MEPYYRYWGKAKKSPDADGPEYHLLPYHNLDVAAAGYLLLDPAKSLCKDLANELSVDVNWLRSFFTFCLTLHDLGKFCRSFQNLAPNLSDVLVPFDGQFCYDVRHDSLGHALWLQVLRKKVGLSLDISILLDDWLEIVCGHHGQPPQNATVKRHLLQEDEQAAEQFFNEVKQKWCPDLAVLTSIDPKKFKQASWQLAGVAVLADWLGSNQVAFPYKSDPISLERYWTDFALIGAEKALAISGVGERSINPFESIRQQFPFVRTATPLQEYAHETKLAASAQLFILEDVTGAGKTEAAMVLVHRLLSAALADGVYVGLPTMATANAMYQRMAESYRNLFSDEYRPSLVLAHGARASCPKNLWKPCSCRNKTVIVIMTSRIYRRALIAINGWQIVEKKRCWLMLVLALLIRRCSEFCQPAINPCDCSG
jgi:CRISPR-associated endonuclease Cas3-HD